MATAAHMTRDLAAQAQNYLSESLDVSISAIDRQKLVTWICSKLDEERQGWKKKVQMSFKEIEKERKLALDLHASIQRLNYQFEDYGDLVYLFREASMYRSTDVDSRVNGIVQLERNIQAMLRSVEHLYNEKVECCKILQLTDMDGSASGGLAQRIRELKDAAENSEDSTEETEKRLLLEIKNLTEALDMQTKLNSQEREMHEKEVMELTKIITSLKRKIPRPDKQRTKVHKQCQVNFPKPSRECCIQVSLNTTGDGSQSGETLNRNLSKTEKHMEKELSEQSIQDGKLEQTDQPKQIRHSPENNFEEKFKRIKLKKLISETNEKKPTQNSLNQLAELSKRKEDEGSLVKEESRNQTKSKYLRGQVVNLARKLDQAKVQMDHYQQQLALMKLQNTQHNSVLPAEGGVTSTLGKYSSRSVQDFRSEEEGQGYLTGMKVKEIKKTASQQDILDFNPQPSKNPQKQGKTVLSYTSTAKCLRCNSVYKLKENHTSACRYHAKSKHRIEKYDSSGRLQNVFFMWQCCMQNSEAPGCKTGEHI